MKQIMAKSLTIVKPVFLIAGLLALSIAFWALWLVAAGPQPQQMACPP